MNKVIQIGNLTKPPEVRATGSGVSVCSFTIAVQRRFTSQSGEKITDFFPVTVWKGLADNCGKYLDKGSKVAVIGELQTRSYDAKDGSKRYVTEIVADEVEFLTPKSAGEQRGYESQDALSQQGFQDIEDEELPFSQGLSLPTTKG
jgi:single-strand DNA-binding protein